LVTNQKNQHESRKKKLRPVNQGLEKTTQPRKRKQARRIKILSSFFFIEHAIEKIINYGAMTTF